MRRMFSLVSYLEGHVKKEIILLQHELYIRTGSRKCLDDRLPHITLGDGIIINDDMLEGAEGIMNETLSRFHGFYIDIVGFGGKTDRKGGVGEFTTPYVLWLNVSLNKELNSVVEIVRSAVTERFDKRYSMPMPYEPHVTVAFRDLHETGYILGQQFLDEKRICLNTKLSHVSLVERTHDGDKERKRFMFT